MVRALLWLLPGVVLFLVVAALLAPPALLGRTLGLATLAVVPGLLVLVLFADVRRRRGRGAERARTAPSNRRGRGAERAQSAESRRELDEDTRPSPSA